MDKKTLIMQCAMTQFAEKGYHQATMKDIADAAGIAKGGIYFYFKSKEDLVYEVFVQYHDRLFKSVSEAEARYANDPREALIQQISVQFNELTSHSGFLMMFWRGQVDVSDEMKQVSMQLRTKFIIWFRDQIIKTYGRDIEPHAFDLSALMTALIREYMSFVLMHDVELPVQDLSELIVARLDDAAQGVLRSNRSPILSNRIMQSVFPEADLTKGGAAVPRLLQAIDKLLQQLEELRLSEGARKGIQQAVAVMTEEAAQPKPRRIVWEGMSQLIERAIGEDKRQTLTELNQIIAEMP